MKDIRIDHAEWENGFLDAVAGRVQEAGYTLGYASGFVEGSAHRAGRETGYTVDATGHVIPSKHPR